MIEPYNWLSEIKRYYGFSRSELKWLLLSVVVMAFIVGFDDGRPEFNALFWGFNFLLSLVAVAIAVFVHESAHRITGIEQGYKTSFKPSLYALIAGLIISFMSYGKVVFLAYGTCFINIIEKHRLGYFRYQLGYFHLGTTTLMGPLANMLAAVVFHALPLVPDALREKIVWVNILVALTSFLPVPGLDGPQILYASRWLYFLVLGAMIALSVFMLKGFPWWAVIIAAVLGGVACWVGFRLLIEPKL
ncbi:hypothetical protein HY640_00095 [Candidatus Woesearchaeota archaeon]|nr:hypothetical protein [Candidatus Woesearchaeota archaeon]